MEITLGNTHEPAFTHCSSFYSNQFTDPNPNVSHLCFVQNFFMSVGCSCVCVRFIGHKDAKDRYPQQHQEGILLL
jgi:hypothetical protein